MGASPPTIALFALALACSACAHGAGGAAPREATAAVVWPAPPATPRARLVAVLPGLDVPSPQLPWWKTVLLWLTGADPARDSDLPAGSLARPFGVAVASNGDTFVADPDAGRVTRYDSAGRPSVLECRADLWVAPMALALGADGSLFVADAATPRVVRWNAGQCVVLGAGRLDRPTGIAVSGDRIWLADPPRHQIVSLSLAGVELDRIGTLGNGEGAFHFPTSISLATDGTLLIVDALNFRIVRLSAEGRWLGSFGEPGDEPGAFARPKGVASDASGRIFVSDAQQGVVSVFRSDGAFDFALGAPGAGLGEFALPSGLFVSGDRLFVADSQNHRIQQFELLGGSS